VSDDHNHDDRMAAYRRLKEAIEAKYPRGWFVAIEHDVIAAAPDFESLEESLRASGRDPRKVFVVEAGVDYPEYVTIFL
jgi:hypothetical protein